MYRYPKERRQETWKAAQPVEHIDCLSIGVDRGANPRKNKSGFGGRGEVEVDSGATGRVTRELSQEGSRALGSRPPAPASCTST
jgi:hypothetical protein